VSRRAGGHEFLLANPLHGSSLHAASRRKHSRTGNLKRAMPIFGSVLILAITPGGSRRTSSSRENKVPVVGMVERGGRVEARVAAN
jgi:hypothetical protein